VNHSILLHKLQHYGIRGHALDWFSSYLTSRSQVTHVNQATSNLPSSTSVSRISNVSIGVPQGSVLGPLLFLIYVNDINSCDDEALIRLFADDSNIFVCSKNMNTLRRKAEVALRNVSDWLSANRLTLNVEKTSFSVFSNRTHDIDQIVFQNKVIARTTTSMYLGMLIDDGLTWSDNIDNICNKLTKLSYALRTLSMYIHQDMITQIYYAYVYPHITYVIQLYGKGNKTDLDRLQRKQNGILKTLSCKPTRYGTNDIHSELKLLTIENIHKLFSACFVFKQQHHMLPNVFNSYYRRNAEVRERVTRQDQLLHVRRCNLVCGEKALKIFGASLWNDIPDNIRSATSLTMFKSLYYNHLFNIQKGNAQ